VVRDIMKQHKILTLPLVPACMHVETLESHD
jgi:hypothetical protein